MSERIVPAELKFNPQGADQAHEWVKIINRVASGAITGNQGDLPQLTLFRSESQSAGIMGKLFFFPDRGEFEIGMQMQFSTPRSEAFATKEKRRSRLPRILRRHKVNEVGNEEISIVDLSQDIYKAVSPKGYEVEAAEDKGVVISKEGIEFNLSQAVNDHAPSSLEDLMAEMMGPEMWRITTVGLGDISLEAFEDQYAMSAELFEIALKELAKKKSKILTPQAIEMKPPRNALSQAKDLEKMIEAQRRTLTVGGFLDDQETIDELRKKIELEARPNVSFDDVVGHENAKRELKNVMDGLTHPELFENEGTYPPRGVLLYGPSGVGKTMLAKALAAEAHVPFFSIKLADIVHHLYGRSERLISEAFELARRQSPSVLFVDELDAIAPQRQYSSEGSSRLVSVLLTCLDGIEENREDIVLIGATNRLDAIDPAIIRPGRMDLLIEAQLPTVNERGSVFKIKIDKAEELAGKQLFNSEVSWDQILKSTEGMSHADIQEIIRRVLVDNVRMRMQGDEPGLVGEDRLMDQIRSYERIRKARPTFGLGANASGSR